MSFHRGLVSYGSHEFRTPSDKHLSPKGFKLDSGCSGTCPIFANPQHFSHLRNSPKKVMLSAPRKRLIVPPPGQREKARLAGRAFCFIGTLNQATMALLSKGRVSDFERFHFAAMLLERTR